MNAGYDVTTSAPQLVKALQLVANGPEHNVIRGLARLNKKWHIAALKQHHDTMKVAKIDPFVKWTTVQKAGSRATLTAWSVHPVSSIGGHSVWLKAAPGWGSLLVTPGPLPEPPSTNKRQRRLDNG